MNSRGTIAVSETSRLHGCEETSAPKDGLRRARGLIAAAVTSLLGAVAMAEAPPQVLSLSADNPTETYRVLAKDPTVPASWPALTFLERGVTQQGVDVFYEDGATGQMTRIPSFLVIPGAYTHAVGMLSPLDTHESIFVFAVNGNGEVELWTAIGETPGYYLNPPSGAGTSGFTPGPELVQAAFANVALFGASTSLDLVGVVGRNTIAAYTDSPFVTAPAILTIPGVADIHMIDGGDFDGDGKVDLVFLDRNVGRMSIGMNNSTLRAPSFSVTQTLDLQVGGLGAAGLRVGDVDGDGDLDVLATRQGTFDDVAVAENSSGTFAAPRSLVSLPAPPLALAVGDADPADGDLDLMVTVDIGAPGGDGAMFELANDGAVPPGMSVAAAYWGGGDGMSGRHVSWSTVEFTGTLDPAGEATVFTMSGGSGNAADDLVVAPGAGAPNPPQVRIYQTPGVEVTTAAFTAYAATGYGANVAAGNLDGRSTLRGRKDEVLTGPGPGAVYGPQVRAFRRDLANPMAMTAVSKVNLYAYSTLKYGVNVCACDIDGDGMDEIVTGAGPGAVFGPHVRAFNFDGIAVTAMQKINFFAYGTLKYGVNVGCANLDADVFDEILTTPGPGVVFGAVVRGFNYDGASLASIAKVNFNAFASSTHGAKNAGGDLDGDGFDEIGVVRGPGPTQANQYAGFDYDGVVVAALPGFPVTILTTMYGGSIAIDDVVGRRGDATEELLAGAGPDPAAATTVTAGGTSFEAFPGLAYGVNVAGGGLAF